MQSVLKADVITFTNRKKDIVMAKLISKFYLEYVNAFERNMLKGNNNFPTMPVKFNMYKTLSHYNSNDKVVEKKYRSVDNY